MNLNIIKLLFPLVLVVASELTAQAIHLRKISKEQAVSDMQEYYGMLERVHPDLLAKIPYSDYLTLKNQNISWLNSLEDSLTVNDFALRISEIAAQIEDGHTNIWGWRSTVKGDWASPFGGILGTESVTKYPEFVLQYENGNFFVTAANNDLLLNIKVEKLNGQPLHEYLRKNILKYISGETFSYKANKFSENQKFWYTFTRLFSQSQFVTVSGISRNGRSVTVEAKTVVESEFDQLLETSRQFENEPRLSKGTYIEFFDSNNVAYLSYPDFVYKDQELKRIDSIFALIQINKSKALIIDLRGNGGGSSPAGEYLFSYVADSTFSFFSRIKIKVSKDILYPSVYYSKMLENLTDKEFAEREKQEYLSKYSGLEGLSVYENTSQGIYPVSNNHFSGKIYVLIDNSTFSTAVGFTALVRDYVRGTIIGFETGGVPCAFGNAMGFALTNSKITGGISWKQFYNPIPRLGDDSHGIIPDILVDRSQLLEFLALSDPVKYLTLRKVESEVK